MPVNKRSTYGKLLKAHWEKAIEQWQKHVISYSTAHEIYSYERARYYFNSFIKPHSKTGEELRAILEVLEARATQTATEAEALPPGAPPKPSPNAAWNPAKEEW